MSQNPAFDASIPVLTEVVTEPPLAPAAASPDATAPTPATLEAAAVAQWGPAEWEMLERRVSERILQQLQGRVDFVLEQRVRDSMAEVLQRAVSGLADEIRAGLRDTIEQIVTRAVAHEVAHLQAQKK